MKKVKRMIAVFLYLLIVSVVLQLELRKLLNLRQLILVVAGGLILYLPGMDWKEWRKKKAPDYGLFARNILYASYIETFIVLFFMLYGGDENSVQLQEQSEVFNIRTVMKNIALSLRPLLYGICIWAALGGEEQRVENKNMQSEQPKKTWTVQECYERFLELGLTRREAEVAVQVGKGLSNKEIAVELNITEATVKKHVANIFEKLAVEKREEIKERLL